MTDFSTPVRRPPPAGQPRQWRADGLVAAAVTAVQLAAHYESLNWYGHHGGAANWAIYVLLSVSGLALVWRRRYPTAVLAVSLGATLWATKAPGGTRV